MNTIKATDLYRMQLIQDAEISPNGKFVVSVVQRVREKDQKKFSNLYLHDVSTGKEKNFTTGNQSDTNPKWSPDGKTIAFISNRDNEKQPQIYLISLEGGEAQKLTDLSGEFLNYSWSPDGKKFICEFRKKNPEAIERENDEAKNKLGIVSRQITRVFYRLDGYGWYPDDRRHIWEINAKSGKAKQLTNHPVFDETGPFLSSDGNLIGYFSNQTPDPDLQPDRIDLFILDSVNEKTRKIETPIGPKWDGSFSPDGKWITYIVQIGEGEGWRNHNIWVIPTDGGRPAKNLTEKYDLHVNGSTLNDNGPAPVISPSWSSDSQWIFFQEAKHGNVRLMKVNVETGELIPVIDEVGVVGKPKFDSSQTKLMYIFGQSRSLPQIFVRSMDANQQTKQISHFN